LFKLELGDFNFQNRDYKSFGNVQIDVPTPLPHPKKNKNKQKLTTKQQNLIMYDAQLKQIIVEFF